MPAWSNAQLNVYHGTDDVSLGGTGGVSQGTALGGFVVNLALCRPLTDFGQGFYTTTSLHQAREWANARVRRVLSPTQTHIAVVIQFNLGRDWLAGLDVLAFARPIVDFWNLVTDCRNGFPPHQRSGSQAAYDVVYGPVTLWPSRLLIQDCDQISFHTPAAVNALPTPVVADVPPGGAAVFP
jgi:hypothetical protein